MDWESYDHSPSWDLWDSNDSHSPPSDYSSRHKFEKIYYCSSYSTVGKPSLENGGRITMPASALPLLVDMDVSYPMQFRIANYGPGGKSSHCGVLEFSAEEGFVYMPQWMMYNVGLNDGDLVTVANVALPKGEYLKLRPHSMEFVNGLENPKEVLEATLREYSCLTAGDTVVVCHHGKRFNVDVVETRPSDAVSVTDTDCNVDFDTPLDYKEPEKPQKNDDKDKEKEETLGFMPFTGIGRTLDGKLTETEKAESNSHGSSSLSKNGDKEKKGKAVFGDKRRGSRPDDGLRDVKEEPQEEDKFQAFTGKKYTLGSS